MIFRIESAYATSSFTELFFDESGTVCTYWKSFSRKSCRKGPRERFLTYIAIFLLLISAFTTARNRGTPTYHVVPVEVSFCVAESKIPK